MKDYDSRSDLHCFIDELHGALIAVGKPSLAELCRIADRELGRCSPEGIEYRRLPKATTNDILGKKRRRAPSWSWTLTYLTALQAAARKRGIDPAVIGGPEQWRQKHAAVIGLTTVPCTVAATDDRGQADAQFVAWLSMIDQPSASKGRHGFPEVAPRWLELFLHLESGAAEVRTYESGLIPGLLQTAEYAQSVIARHLPEATPDEVARLAGQRAQRRLPCRHHDGFRAWAIIEEAALRDRLVDAPTMRAQIESLLSLTGEPWVTIQVVPSGPADSVAPSGPFTIFRFPEQFLSDAVCLEQQTDLPVFLRERKNTEHYDRVFGDLAVRAASPEDTRLLLQEICDEA